MQHLAKPGKGSKASLAFGLRAVRTVEDYDWLAALKTLFPKLEVARGDGTTHCTIPAGSLPMFPAKLSCSIPDARTLVSDVRFDTGGVAVPAKRTTSIWAEDWKHVERGLAALAIDGRDLSWLHDYLREKGDDEERYFTAILAHCESLVFGLDATDELTLSAYGRAATEKDAVEMATAVNSLLALGRATLKESERKLAAGVPPRELPMQLLREVVEHSEVRREGKTVRWRAATRIDLKDWLPALITDGL